MTRTTRKYDVQNIQSVLRYLVVSSIALSCLTIIGLFVFSEPPEITTAVEVMAEFNETEMSAVGILIALTIFAACLALYFWSLWQLYHLDERGIDKFLWALGIRFILMLVSGGSWESAPLAVLDSLGCLVDGAIVCICFLNSEVFKTHDSVVGTEYGGTDEVAA